MAIGQIKAKKAAFPPKASPMIPKSTYLPFLLLCCLLPSLAFPQSYENEIIDYRLKQLQETTAGNDSPLWPEDSAGISFYSVSPTYRIEAKVEILTGETPFEMPTYDGATKAFIRYARLSFEINGKRKSLVAYKDLSVPGPLAALYRSLLVPFKDETNDEETYGGGRYLDLVIPKNTKTIVLDFNKAYNPYCAYSDGYRCPIPPRENHLDFKIPAGEKRYTGIRRNRGLRPGD